MTDLYKVQKQDSNATDFQDVGGWRSATECIGAMRELILENPLREVRVIAENGVVIASTRASAAHQRPAELEA